MLLALRLGLARALVASRGIAGAHFLFLDEPLASADESRGQAFLELLRSFDDEFAQVFVTSTRPLDGAFAKRIKIATVDQAREGVWPKTRRRPGTGEGLRFTCARCGNCCRGPEPGYVWVTDDEVRALAARLGLSLDAFGSRYLRRIGARLSLVERANHDCVFWEEGQGCTRLRGTPRAVPDVPLLVRDRGQRARAGGDSAGARARIRGGSTTRPEIERLAKGEGETRGS